MLKWVSCFACVAMPSLRLSISSYHPASYVLGYKKFLYVFLRSWFCLHLSLHSFSLFISLIRVFSSGNDFRICDCLLFFFFTFLFLCCVLSCFILLFELLILLFGLLNFCSLWDEIFILFYIVLRIAMNLFDLSCCSSCYYESILNFPFAIPCWEKMRYFVLNFT
ncbi:Uncharacterized protein TCM_014021 [Theobroma cacao]|uniref:Uncharacterized protein n=1 Tax=Theobroma cacao TaxID=3641 RepID=A0A061G4A7_THECC|nr:Uncharacterized protein TCM_014021 [Theobroma cacao]